MQMSEAHEISEHQANPEATVDAPKITLSLSTIEEVNKVFHPSIPVEKKTWAAYDYAGRAVLDLSEEEIAEMLTLLPPAHTDFEEDEDVVLAMGVSEFVAGGFEPKEATVAGYLYAQLCTDVAYFDEWRRQDLHDSYINSLLEEVQETERPRYRAGIAEYQKHIAERSCSDEEREALNKRFSSLAYVLIDPVKLYADRMKIVESLTEHDIDTSTLFEEPAIFTVAGQYAPDDHLITALIDGYDDADFRMYLFHEHEHAMSVRLEHPRTGEAKKIGFMAVASRGKERTITMHRRLNEGFNDYKARQDLGLDPTDRDGSYPDCRLIVGRLIDLTGQELWDDFYSPQNTFDAERRKRTFKALAVRLGEIGGAGFLNRLDTTWALNGSDHVVEILDRQAYSELTYTPIRDLKTAAEEVMANTLVITFDSIDTVDVAELVAQLVDTTNKAAATYSPEQ